MGNTNTNTNTNTIEDTFNNNEESTCYLLFINMGNSVSGTLNSSSSSGSHKSSKKSIDKKVELASKTGVLSLCGMVCYYYII
jgi:hypothetical protein